MKTMLFKYRLGALRASRITLTISVVLVISLSIVSYANNNLAFAAPVCTPAPSGLVSWWQGEKNGKDRVDGNDASLADVMFAKGKVGKAFNFDNPDADILIPASSSLDVGAGDGLTIELWIKPTTVDDHLPIVEWNQVGNPNPGVWLWNLEPGRLGANIVDTSDNSHVLESSSGVIIAGQFQHVAVTYEKLAGMAALYYNGRLQDLESVGGFTPQTSYDLYLGAHGPSSDVYQGLLDEIHLYNRALSKAEIKSVYAARSAGLCSPIANAGPDQSVDKKTTVTLDGSASSSQSARSLTYQWEQIRGPIVTLSDSTIASPTFTAPGTTTKDKILMFKLTVNDGVVSSTDTVKITVLRTLWNFEATIDGSQEVPAKVTDATGEGTFTYNYYTNLLEYSITYSGLSSAETMAHIHQGAPGVNGGVIITLPSGTSKSGSATLTADQETALFAGNLYVNIHSTNFSGGEIRGQIVPAS